MEAPHRTSFTLRTGFEYNYADMAQGLEDGYLALCEIVKGRLNLDERPLTVEEATARNPVMRTPASPSPSTNFALRTRKSPATGQTAGTGQSSIHKIG